MSGDGAVRPSLEVTHHHLVKLAAKWLGRSESTVLVTEMHSACSLETPDVIAWNGWGSTLIECKVSRADFLRDRGKPFRKHPALGMGQMRYFLVPHGMVQPHELPERWGLLYARGTHVHLVCKSQGFAQRNRQAEISLLVSLLRRIELRLVRDRQLAGACPRDVLNQVIKDRLKAVLTDSWRDLDSHPTLFESLNEPADAAQRSNI